MAYLAGMDATTFAALGETNRLQMVELLRHGPCAVGELVERLQIRQPQVSKHLAVLRDTGLVVVEPRGRQRIHGLRSEPFEQISHWADSFERLWEARLDNLGAHLAGRRPLDTEGGSS